MDLRKSVLLRQRILSDSLNISGYDSAIEDSDNSVYYSFVDDSIKSVDTCVSGNDENEASISSTFNEEKENNSMSSEDKENTVIMRTTEEAKDITDFVEKNELTESENKDLSQADGEISMSSVGSAVKIIIQEAPEDGVSTNEAEALEKQIEAGSGSDLKEQNSPNSFEDPNKNRVNPFEILRTLTTEEVQARSAPTASIQPKIEKRVTRQSIGKIQTTTFQYLPVLRQSLDRKSKAFQKPAPPRRTIFGAVSKTGLNSNLKAKTRQTLYDVTTQAIPLKSATQKPSTSVPKPLIKPIAKPRIFKCTVAGCYDEYPTLKALQDHQNAHKSLNVATSSFVCKWCDKKFQIETALQTHLTEKCTRVPFNEKRKMLTQRDKKEVDRRRTTLFTIPVTKRKSPVRKGSKHAGKNNSNLSINKSGIKITPRKTMKCHICQMLIPDALTFATHIVGHKRNALLQELRN